jgi:putative ABC transport system permease protein
VGSTGLAVSHDLAHDRGWHVGSRATLTFPGGATQPVTLRAIYDDNTLLSDVVVPESLWNAHAIQPSDSLVLIATKSGTSAATVQRTIAPLATRNGGDAQSVPEFVGTSSAGLNTLLNIVYVMLALAILIALLGIANALSLAVYERRTELGLLRAVGETRRQVRSMLRWESVIVSTFGTVFGLVLGAVLGGVLFATVAGSGGTFALPLARLLIVALIGALAGVVAAIRPARRAARVPVLEAITAS